MCFNGIIPMAGGSEPAGPDVIERLKFWRDLRSPTTGRPALPMIAEACADAIAEIECLRILLTRLRQWDHLEGAADGPFWRQEIDAALARSMPSQKRRDA